MYQIVSKTTHPKADSRNLKKFDLKSNVALYKKRADSSLEESTVNCLSSYEFFISVR